MVKKLNNILFINACVRKNSRTYDLAKTALSNLKGELLELNLEKENIKPLNSKSLEKRDEYISMGKLDVDEFSYARQFANADTIVLAAPYWDLSFPAMVKIYFETITVLGITFKYSPEGMPIGMCKCKRFIYVTTSGGAIGKFNMGFDYVKNIAENMYGINDVMFFSAENLDIQNADTTKILNGVKAEISTKLTDIN